MSALFAVTGLLSPAGFALANFTWVDRPDPMHNHRLADSDRVGDTVRVLYYSSPSLPQSASGNWTVNVYIAELLADGSIENRLLASGRRNLTSLILQRGGEAVFAVPAAGHGQISNTVEVWSAADSKMLTTITSPSLAGIGGAALPVFPTDDGNFFVVHHSAQSGRGGEPTTLPLYKFSPQGEVLARGQWINPTATSGVGGAFAVPGNGMGLSVNMSVARGVNALDIDIEAVRHFDIGGREIEARVHSETRLLVTDASGAVNWLSPGLERTFAWDGQLAIPLT